MLRCESCGRISTFRVFRLYAGLGIVGFSVIPFHKRYLAVCGECAARYTLAEEKGSRLRLRRRLFVTASDLTRWEGEKEGPPDA